MSTIEAITLEYSYLLSSQLEAMRQHYETLQIAQSTRIAELEASQATLVAKEASVEEATTLKEKAERKATKALELFKSLSKELESERALASGLSTRVKSLQQRLDGREEELGERLDQVKGLEETVRDLMFSLEAGAQIRREGDEAVGGDLILGPSGGSGNNNVGKKKVKK
jgi:BRCA1-associated protein